MTSLANARQRSISNGYFTIAEKLDTLIGMLGNRLRVFLIVDALDEALDHERTDILGALERLRSCTDISTLLSTRVPLNDEGLRGAVVSIDGVEENTDIRTALDIELSIGGRLGGISDAQMVRNELMMKAGGKCVFKPSFFLYLLMLNVACAG